MSKIKLEDIREAAIEQGWTVLSEEYKNLDTEMVFECNEGHKVYAPYKKIRDRWECPICKKNKYNNFDEKIIPKDNMYRINNSTLEKKFISNDKFKKIRS